MTNDDFSGHIAIQSHFGTVLVIYSNYSLVLLFAKTKNSTKLDFKTFHETKCKCISFRLRAFSAPSSLPERKKEGQRICPTCTHNSPLLEYLEEIG